MLFNRPHQMLRQRTDGGLQSVPARIGLDVDATE